MEFNYSFTGLVLILNALAELVKRTPVYEKVKNWYPVLVEVGGVVLGLLTGFTWFESLLIGLVAMGLYDTAKTTVNFKK
jgi:hypothetical protein